MPETTARSAGAAPARWRPRLTALDYDRVFPGARCQAFADRLLACLAMPCACATCSSLALATAPHAGGRPRGRPSSNAAQTLHLGRGTGSEPGAALMRRRLRRRSLAPWLRDPTRDPGRGAARIRRRAPGRPLDHHRAHRSAAARFSPTGLAPVEHACGLALLALDLAAPLRAPLARHLLQGWRARWLRGDGAAPAPTVPAATPLRHAPGADRLQLGTASGMCRSGHRPHERGPSPASPGWALFPGFTPGVIRAVSGAGKIRGCKSAPEPSRTTYWSRPWRA